MSALDKSAGWAASRSIALLIGVGGLTLYGCSAQPRPPENDYNTLSAENITLHLPANLSPADQSVETFFQSHIVIVSHVAASGPASDEYWLEYPSINSGPSPLYSHRVTIAVPSEFPITIERIIEDHRAAVLLSSRGSSTWTLIGYTTRAGRTGQFDWFSDYPDLLYTKRKALDSS